MKRSPTLAEVEKALIRIHKKTAGQGPTWRAVRRVVDQFARRIETRTRRSR